uniref:Metalloendopeptidase n=1 Tax=Ditylenchus dipsaci TaxID=166011 RepID=A0A915DSD1_9BILA
MVLLFKFVLLPQLSLVVAADSFVSSLRTNHSLPSEICEVDNDEYTRPSSARKKRSTVGRQSNRIWNDYPEGKKFKIPYAIATNYDSTQMERIKGAISDIERNTCIKFELINDEQMANFYKNKSHVEIQSVSGGGCHSVIGRMKNKKNMVKLEIRATATRTCIAHHVILHELLHLLGLYHEHQRPDRDNYITINSVNALKERLNNFNKALGAESFGLPYDYASIMHYRGYTFSSNNQPVISTKVTKFQDTLGITKIASELDWLKVNVLYQCDGYQQMITNYENKVKALNHKADMIANPHKAHPNGAASGVVKPNLHNQKTMPKANIQKAKAAARPRELKAKEAREAKQRALLTLKAQKTAVLRPKPKFLSQAMKNKPNLNINKKTGFSNPNKGTAAISKNNGGKKRILRKREVKKG